MTDFLSFFTWYDTCNTKTKPWLIIGKGPSYAKHIDYDLSAYNVISLNHVINQLNADFAHMIDLDVFDACQYSIDKNALYLIMPWVPHQDNKPGKQTLADLVKIKPLLAKLAAEERLLFYNHVPDQCFGDSPLVRVLYFSAEAAINLLASCGVTTIRTLGVDGGTSYSQSFSHLNDITLLSNGRESFDKQFSEIAKTIMSFNIDLAPLNIQSPVKIYVATTEAQMLSVKVLEYSIRKHASMSVEVIPLHLSKIDIPLPKDIRNLPRTPFSFQRLLIPEMQGYKGRAIYLDSDMQVFKDIKDVWMQGFNEAQILTVSNADDSDRHPQFSVMLLDCDRLDWDICKIVTMLNKGELTYENLIYDMSIVSTIRPKIASIWNSLESYQEGKTALLHYTDMNTQPWVSVNNPLGYLWFRDLFKAIDSGFISINLVKEHVEKGYIRPSVMYQIEHKIEDSLLLTSKAKKMDQNFIAPYQAIHAHSASPWRSRKAVAKAYLRHLFQQAGLIKLKVKLISRLKKSHYD